MRYAGIGARKTPTHVLIQMQTVAREMVPNMLHLKRSTMPLNFIRLGKNAVSMLNGFTRAIR